MTTKREDDVVRDPDGLPVPERPTPEDMKASADCMRAAAARMLEDAATLERNAGVEPDTRSASNRDRWWALGVNGGLYPEADLEHSALRETMLLDEVQRADCFYERVTLVLDDAMAPVEHDGVVLGMADRIKALIAARTVKRSTPLRPKVGAWIQRGSGAYVVDDHGQEAGSVWPSGTTWAWTARRAFLPQLSAHQLATKEAAQAACLEVLRTWADAEGEPRRETTHDDSEACPSCSIAFGSPSPCAVTHDFRPGAYSRGPATMPEPQETVAEVKQAARLEATAHRLLKDLGGKVTRASLALAAVDCGGEDIEQMATNAAGEIRRLRAAAPKAIEPSGPLSMVATRDRSGGWSVIDRAGPWKTIEVDECPSPPSFGLWLWSGKAEAERDEQVGGWDFIGEWTALPLPVLPDGNASPVEVQRSARTLEAEVSRLEARLKALGDNPDNQRQIVCPSCGEKAWSVCVHLADRMAPPA